MGARRTADAKKKYFTESLEVGILLRVVVRLMVGGRARRGADVVIYIYMGGISDGFSENRFLILLFVAGNLRG